MLNIISMNIRGLGADPKFLALKELFRSSNSKIILIQETMHGSQDSISYFRRMLPSWHMAAMDASSLFGGLVFLWDSV